MLFRYAGVTFRSSTMPARTFYLLCVLIAAAWAVLLLLFPHEWGKAIASGSCVTVFAVGFTLLLTKISRPQAHTQMIFAFALWKANKLHEAKRYLQRAAGIASLPICPNILFSLVYAGLGDAQKQAKYLAAAQEQGYTGPTDLDSMKEWLYAEFIPGMEREIAESSRSWLYRNFNWLHRYVLRVLLLFAILKCIAYVICSVGAT